MPRYVSHRLSRRRPVRRGTARRPTVSMYRMRQRVSRLGMYRRMRR